MTKKNRLDESLGFIQDGLIRGAGFYIPSSGVSTGPVWLLPLGRPRPLDRMVQISKPVIQSG